MPREDAAAEEQLDARVSLPEAHLPEPGRDSGTRPLDAGQSAVSAPLTNALDDGTLQGKAVGQTRMFLGIPYAAPPLGALRFAPPVKPQPWSGTRDATSYGPACPQPSDATGALGPKHEDCLLLNVAAPMSATKAPVMVFIHGGGLHLGAASDYPAESLSAAGDVVVVTINYRLGVLGFLAHPALDEALGVPSGNMGLRDQQLALRWVHDNIAKFGGDPEDVTVFGESAGAISSCLHMFMTGSQGLAQRFLMESGTCLVGPFPPAPRSAQVGPLSDELVEQHCSGRTDIVSCLRELPAEMLGVWMSKQIAMNYENAKSQGLDPPNNQDWYPYIDGQLITEAPLESVRKGMLEKKPVLLGSNRHEWALIQHFGFPKATSRVDMLFWAGLLHPTFSTEILAEYLPDNDADADVALESIWTDELFRCPARRLAREYTKLGIDVYLYSFEVEPGFHSQELDYVFGTSGVSLPHDQKKPVQSAVLQAVQSYWTRFARVGDPNDSSQPRWAPYTLEADPHMTLAAPVAMASKLQQKHCDFWDRLWP